MKPTSTGFARVDVGFYFGAMFLALTMGSPGGLASIPIQYFLKDTLHVRPTSLSIFTALVSVPLYGGFLVGFFRDRLRPSRARDRHYLLIAAPIGVACYLWLATRPISYSELLVTVLLAMLVFVLLQTVTQALMTSVARDLSMTGRLSAVWNIAGSIPFVISSLAGGWLVHQLPAQRTFLISAGVTAAIFLNAFWRPDAIFARDFLKTGPTESIISQVHRLIRHRPLWSAIGILFFWSFSPGWQTPLFYQLTEKVNISSEMYGLFMAVITASSIPTLILYGAICKRLPLSKLLWFGTLLTVIQDPTLLFARSTSSVIIVAIVAGMLGGIGAGAYWDLVMRSCPKGLEGTAYMLAVSSVSASTSCGDILGSWLYVHYGFFPAILIATLSSTLILPMLLLVPRDLTASTEQERTESIE